MSFSLFMKTCLAVFSHWEVLAAVAALFIAGAVMRFVAVGRSQGAVGLSPLKILKKIKKAPQPAKAAAPPDEEGEDAGEERPGRPRRQGKEKDDEGGLEEESYPTEDEAPKKRNKKK